ncbi:hypothetical protein RDI58_026789 [Solanum bulbocastanum]|uniref:Uncharacterized protein n=1 Tax=Solanum bulbocastanum TaxID=147425 RepID=A0AAN8SU94_SOLBU
MCNCLQNGIVLDVNVHMPDEESGASFSKVGTTENRASENIEYNEVGYDESTEESDDSENSEQLPDDQFGSDVHEELIQLRAKKRSFLRRRKRRERISADIGDVPYGNAGSDLGFYETTINTNILEGRLGG